MLRVRQKVVCINTDDIPDSEMSATCLPNPLVKGAIYIVTGVGLVHPYDLKKRPCITVAEIASKHAFLESRFRPVVERKTDISEFTKLLTSKKKTVDV